MRRLLMLVVAGALAFIVGCGGTSSVESCWNENTNKPLSEGGCRGMSDPRAEEFCLGHWYDRCTQEYG